MNGASLLYSFILKLINTFVLILLEIFDVSLLGESYSSKGDAWGVRKNFRNQNQLDSVSCTV